MDVDFVWGIFRASTTQKRFSHIYFLLSVVLMLAYSNIVAVLHLHCLLFFMTTTCTLHTSSGCGKKEAHIYCSMVTCQGGPRYWKYLEGYWPCAGGLSAANVIGTQLLRDPIN